MFKPYYQINHEKQTHTNPKYFRYNIINYVPVFKCLFIMFHQYRKNKT